MLLSNVENYISVLFSDLRSLQEFAEWSYEPSHKKDGVMKLDLLNHQRSLPSKLGMYKLFIYIVLF